MLIHKPRLVGRQEGYDPNDHENNFFDEKELEQLEMLDLYRRSGRPHNGTSPHQQAQQQTRAQQGGESGGRGTSGAEAQDQRRAEEGQFAGGQRQQEQQQHHYRGSGISDEQMRRISSMFR